MSEERERRVSGRYEMLGAKAFEAPRTPPWNASPENDVESVCVFLSLSLSCVCVCLDQSRKLVTCSISASFVCVCVYTLRERKREGAKQIGSSYLSLTISLDVLISQYISSRFSSCSFSV